MWNLVHYFKKVLNPINVHFNPLTTMKLSFRISSHRVVGKEKCWTRYFWTQKGHCAHFTHNH